MSDLPASRPARPGIPRNAELTQEKQTACVVNTGQRYSGCRLSSCEKILDRGDESHGPAQFDPRR